MSKYSKYLFFSYIFLFALVVLTNHAYAQANVSEPTKAAPDGINVIISESMVPYLNIGDTVAFKNTTLDYSFDNIKKGDIIVFKAPADWTEDGKPRVEVSRVVNIQEFITNGIKGLVVTTKGDNNRESYNGLDFPILKENYIGKVIYKLNTSKFNSKYLTYTDEDLGFSIQYPSNWTLDKNNLQFYTVITFNSPQKDASVSIRIIPTDNKSLKEYGDVNFKQSQDLTLLQYYRNSSTLLSGKPAFRAVYITTYDPGLYDKMLGHQSSTSKAMAIVTMVPEKKSVYAIMYFTSPPNFENHIAEVEDMIKSFKINAKAPIIQEDDNNSSSTEKTQK